MGTALVVAMMAGLEEALRYSSVNVDKLQASMAREKEVCEVVELLIQKRADVNAVGGDALSSNSARFGGITRSPISHQKSPLCAAVQRGSPTLVRMLLDAKADPAHTID